MRRPESVVGTALFLVLVVLVTAARLGRVRRSWPSRVAVDGHSMAPTLHAGDWLLVDPEAYLTRSPAAGDLVVAPDPRAPDHWLIKRVRGKAQDGRLVVVGDHPAHAAEVATVPPIEAAAVVGRPWFRYWPPRRIGRIR